MSPSSPGRTRQSRRPLHPLQAERDPSRRGDVVVRSILLAVAAISVIATSNYLAYLVGRKQVSYEELRRQVDRIVKVVDRKRAEEELAVTTLKQQQDRLEQNASVLTGLTTSTFKGKTVAVPEPASGAQAAAVPLIDDIAPAPVPPSGDVRLPPPEPPVGPVTRHRRLRGVAHQRASQTPASAGPRRSPAKASVAEQTEQSAAVAAPDPGAAHQ